MTQSVKDVVARYRQGAIATGHISDTRKANKGAKQLHACYKILRKSKAGRQALIDLMRDTEPSVRCWAASECLQWVPDNARRVLELLRDSQGSFSFCAEMTLKEYDGGRLKFD